MKKFLILVTYIKDLKEVDSHMKEHICFLDKYYASGNFILSGRRNPRVGGLILAKFESRELVEQILKEDPFFINQIANYEVIEFEPTRGLSLE
jgi:uncharacterized protein YciI